MELQTRALYNLIYFNLLQDKEIQCEHWQKEDYRSLSDEQLFEGIRSLGFPIQQEQLFAFIEDADSPEALTEFYIEESEDPAAYDALYLYLFEIWRRHFPEKKTLSLFCDELDHLIYLYDNHLLESDEPLQDALESLKIVLEDGMDEGQNPKQAWELINQYCAHNLSSFLYDYISELIDSGHEKYAMDLIESFYAYSDIERWFAFLVLRCCSHEDEQNKAEEMVDSLIKHPDFELQLEVLDFLLDTPFNDLFKTLLSKTIFQAEDKDSLLELVDLCNDFYSIDSKKQDVLYSLTEKIENSDVVHPEHLKEFSEILK